jgi:hypothetical protein
MISLISLADVALPRRALRAAAYSVGLVACFASTPRGRPLAISMSTADARNLEQPAVLAFLRQKGWLQPFQVG